MTIPSPPHFDRVSPAVEGALAQWLPGVERALFELCHGLALGQWEQLTKGSSAALENLSGPHRSVYADPALMTTLQRWHQAVQAGYQPRNKAFAQKLKLLRREVIQEAARADVDVQTCTDKLTQKLSQRRTLLRGEWTEDGAITRTLESNPDRALREEAWRARALSSTTYASDIRSLCQHRNRYAKKVGFNHYAELGHETSGLEGPKLLKWLEEVEAETNGLWHTWVEEKSQSLGVEQLRPWDLSFDPLSTDLSESYFPHLKRLPLIQRTCQQLGFDVSRMQFDLASRPGKSEHAWCIPVDPPEDIRITAPSGSGVNAYATLLHEVGHAVYAASVEGESFLLRAAPCSALDEGVAQFFAAFTDTTSWLIQEGGLPENEALTLVKRRKKRRVSALRWQLLWLHLEQHLYDQPDHDPTDYFWELYERFLLKGASSDLQETAPWARVIHLVSHPMYLQNYLVADLIAAHLGHCLKRRFGVTHGQTVIGEFLRTKLLARGAVTDWQDLLQHATGSVFSVSDAVQHRVGGS